MAQGTRHYAIYRVDGARHEKVDWQSGRNRREALVFFAAAQGIEGRPDGGSHFAASDGRRFWACSS